jgi:hypothetical protein
LTKSLLAAKIQSLLGASPPLVATFFAKDLLFQWLINGWSIASHLIYPPAEAGFIPEKRG